MYRIVPTKRPGRLQNSNEKSQFFCLFIERSFVWVSFKNKIYTKKWSNQQKTMKYMIEILDK